MLDKIVSILTSLKLTVACLAMALVLVFVGTLAQVKLGLFLAQEQYFQSLFVYWTPRGADFRLPVWPGGYLLGAVLLVNLLAAHIKRFQFSRKKLGIFLTHAGLILLLLGQFFTEVFSIESHMRLEEGERKNYSESDRYGELVVIDATDAETDRVVPFIEDRLRTGTKLAHKELPFEIEVKSYYQNSRLTNNLTNPASTQGSGQRVEVKPVPKTVKMDERNVPSAVVELTADSSSLGTWLVSPFLDTQTFTHDGRTYRIGLRWLRLYKPFYIQLHDFTHERYPGTEIPKNFSSHIQLTRPDTGEDREHTIYMNNPLRYWGETYYQGGFEPGDKVSILQVVRNPAWLTPYLSVTLVGIGLTVQFMFHLISFLRRRIS